MDKLTDYIEYWNQKVSAGRLITGSELAQMLLDVGFGTLSL